MKTFPFALALLLGALPTFAQGTAFNYQGHLDVSNSPAYGNFDLQFALYANSTGGSPTAGPVTNTAVAVTNGIFTTAINFGSGAFTGATNWLDIAVRTNLPAFFTELTPRQQILPVPYAIYAGTAATATTAVTASNVALGAISGSDIAASTITAANIASGQVVKSLDGLSDAVTLAAANNLYVTTNGNILTIGGGIDYVFGYYYLSVSGSYTLTSKSPIPISNDYLNGWTYNNSTAALLVPATGYYLIQYSGFTYSSSDTGGERIAVAVNGSTTSFLNGSDTYTFNGQWGQFSSTFIAPLTAGQTIQFLNFSASTVVLEVQTGTGTIFSFSITRIN